MLSQPLQNCRRRLNAGRACPMLVECKTSAAEVAKLDRESNWSSSRKMPGPYPAELGPNQSFGWVVVSVVVSNATSILMLCVSYKRWGGTSERNAIICMMSYRYGDHGRCDASRCIPDLDLDVGRRSALYRGGHTCRVEVTEIKR